MKRILFLVLALIPVLGPMAHGSIEIYVNGHRYNSFQAYQDSKRSKGEAAPVSPATLDNQQEDYILQKAQQLGINVDLSKVKTFQIKQQILSDKALYQLYLNSVEHGVVGALKDFYQTGDITGFNMPRSLIPGIPFDHRISTEKLQETIQQAVTTSKEPRLLISEPGKMRIMALKSDKVFLDDEKTGTVNGDTK